MKPEQRFRQYDLVELEVHRGQKDDRPESFRPDIDSLRIVGHLETWKERDEVMQRVATTSTCELRAAVNTDRNAPSLGMVRVAHIAGLKIVPFAGWSDAQKKRIAAAESLTPLDLFGDHAQSPPELQAPRFTVHYVYRCTAAECPQHVGQILDWELGELQRRHMSHLPVEDAEREITEKFVKQKYGPARETAFFMGNFGDIVKRGSFSVLGVYSPKLSDVSPTLF